jgi:CRP-like cAMP-binding protein
MSLAIDDASRPRILIAEDNYLMAEEVREFLRGCGYAVAGAAASVESGLALIAKDTVDGAVLDIDLGGTPSFPMCRALTAKGVPFLFLSGYGRATVVPDEFSNATHITKPFAPSILESALRRLVGEAPPATATLAEPTFGNGVLDALYPAAKVALAPSLERVALARSEILDGPGQPVSHVYFPVEGLISVFAGTTAATRIEVASIGCDGMTAPGVLLGDDISHGQTVVQATGSAWRIPTNRLLALANGDASLRRLLLRQVGMALSQLADNATYGGRATIVERLARWLVQASCRLGNRRLDLTHDVLAEILGVRRPSVTTGLQMLEGKRLIRSTRRAIVVLDPAGLAELARR